MQRSGHDRRHRVAVLALDDVVAFDLGTPSQLFGAARTADGERLYDVLVCTPGGAPVRSAAGFQVVAEHGLELLDRADTVVVPGIFDEAHFRDGWVAPDVRAALRAAADRGVRIMSICTGAFVLAASGLLDGRPATTHWFYAEQFRRLFPAVRLDPDVLFVDDGDVLTSAGVAAGVDLCLHVIRSDHGSDVAEPGGPPLRRPVLARRWPVAVHPAAGPTTRRARLFHGRGAGVGAAAAGRPARPALAGRAGADERADVHPAVPGGDRSQPGEVVPAAGRARPDAAGDDRPGRRRGCPALRLRHRRRTAPAAPAGRSASPPTAYRTTFRTTA